MSDDTQEAGATAVTPEGDEDEITPGYKAPKQVDIKTIQELDNDDEALVKYKATLLGTESDILDEGGNNVLLKKMILSSGDKKMELDLTGDLKVLKNSPIIIKEGCSYQITVVFRVQREIVAGLRYQMLTYRKSVRVDKGNFMVGSYGPKTEEQIFRTPLEDAPSGLISRGSYIIKSKFTDDDKNIYLEWDWGLKIAKEWE